MKMTRFLATGVSVALVLAIPNIVTAKPEVQGQVDFFGGDGVLRSAEFDARIDNSGAAEGRMIFIDPSAAAESDPDGPGEAVAGAQGLLIDADFDCLVVTNNRAVMSGVIVDSNTPERIGRRILVTVEDNGRGRRSPPRRLTWGIYPNQARNWTPTDGELGFDPGAGTSWLASDAEREDDVPVPSNRSEAVSCDSFPPGSHTLVDIGRDDGNIRVRP
ncbi:MAG TPA: hypothetical protein VGV13_19730 [Methylomirabilota bacterium]|jgi:hypothetical protein|nr:hypothetical protein [Methylomirabilota bacterium]